MSKRLIALAGLGLAALPCADAAAAVSLNITDGSGAPTAGTASQGGTFAFTLNLTSTGEQTTAVSYFLRATGPGSGVLRIADRALAGSAYPDPAKADSTVEAQPASLLNPENDENLGSGVSDVNNGPTPGAGTFLVANYTIAVSPTAPLGTYTITTISPAGEGYVGPSPSFSEVPFTAQATYSLTVVPEPTGLAAAIGGAGLLALSRRRPRLARRAAGTL